MLVRRIIIFATSRASDADGMCVVLEPGQFLSYRGSIRSDVELTNKNDGYNIYDTAVSPELSFSERANTRGNIINCIISHFIMIYESIFLCMCCKGLPGIACLIQLLMLALLMHLKARLGKFWQHEAVKFDFTADLTGTENR